MPHTINGIGTHYYGAKNRSARIDICQTCGRSATLSSYDTREFFCVIFVPIIPLGKYRILNDCSSCRRHHRIKADEFARQLDEATAPLREAIRRSPRDPQPYVELVQALIAWEMRTDAERELEAAAQLFPQNIELILQTAQMAVDRGDWNRALPHFECAYGLDSQNPAATYGYGWILHRLERHEQAVPILQRAVSQEGNKLGATWLLAESHAKLSHWNDALSAYQQLLSIEPAYAQDKKILGAISDCKKRLGYELTDAERRAGRRWWPFGRKSKPVTLQAQPTLVRPSLRIAGIVLLIVMVLSLGFVAWDEKTNIKVYFDNGLDRAVQVDVDGNKFDLGPQGLRSESMKEGAHTLIVRDAAGKEIERHAFRLDEQSFFDAVLHDRFFVYNVGSQHVYRRANHVYAKRAEDATYADELIGMQRFLEQRDVDYEFSGAPEQISTESKSSVVRKVSFTVAQDVSLATYAVIRLNEGKADDAKAAIDRAAANTPCHTPTRRTQVYLATMIGTRDAGATAARRWIADCAQDDLEAHRAYQDVYTEQGLQTSLRDEYARLVASSPQSAKAHYLNGRVAADPAVAVREHQEAIRLDPRLTWPRIALGHAYAEMERYDDGLRELAAALDVEGCEPFAVHYYATAAIAKGSPADAVTKIEQIRSARTNDMVAVEARWLIALAAADWDTAASMQKILKAHESPDVSWWRETKMLRFKADPAVDQRIEEALASEELRGLATQAKISRLFEKGEYAQAAEMAAKNTKGLGTSAAALLQAYAAGGLLLQGDRAAATKLLGEVDPLIANAPDRESRVIGMMVEAFRGEKSTDAVIRETRDNNAMRHGVFAAAVQAALANDRVRASAHLARATRAASDLEFPYLEVKAMASRVK